MDEPIPILSLSATDRRPPGASVSRAWSRWVAAIGLTVLLASFAQGSRGLWEPDEGFYANAAMEMAAGGGWSVPQVNHHPFLDKPPLDLWSLAAGILLLGRNTWSLRLAHALWFAATAFLVGLLAARLRRPSAGPIAMAVYASMLAPFLASNAVTPDTALTFWVVAMAYAYWRSRSAEGLRRRRLWMVAAGVAAGMGMLTKGPAMLIFAFPLGVHLLLCDGWPALLRREVLLGGAIALGIGGSWYVWVMTTVPGAAAYLFECQVSGRLWSTEFERNADWVGPLRVYLPMLLLGGLPWSAFWPRWARQGWKGGYRSLWNRLRRRSDVAFLLLWVGLPLLLLSCARSRLPLYALPAMPALAIGTAWALDREAPHRGLHHRRWLAVAFTWIFLLLVSRTLFAWLPSDSDTAALATRLADLHVGTGTRVLTVDTKRNGLPFYGYDNLVWTRLTHRPYPFFSPPESLAEELSREGGSTAGEVFLVRETHLAPLLETLTTVGATCRLLDRFEHLAIVRCGEGQAPPEAADRHQAGLSDRSLPLAAVSRPRSGSGSILASAP